jgi:hypothetical protein
MVALIASNVKRVRVLLAAVACTSQRRHAIRLAARELVHVGLRSTTNTVRADADLDRVAQFKGRLYTADEREVGCVLRRGVTRYRTAGNRRTSHDARCHFAARSVPIALP